MINLIPFLTILLILFVSLIYWGITEKIITYKERKEKKAEEAADEDVLFSINSLINQTLKERK